MPSSRTSTLGVIALSWSDDSAVQEKTEQWAEIKEGFGLRTFDPRADSWRETLIPSILGPSPALHLDMIGLRGMDVRTSLRDLGHDLGRKDLGEILLKGLIPEIEIDCRLSWSSSDNSVECAVEAASWVAGCFKAVHE
jgi:hypothetical protein